MKPVFQVLLSAIVFVILDFIYLNLMKEYFQGQIKNVQGAPIQLDMMAALLCYIFLILGLNYFILQKRRSVQDAFLLGLVIYAVYELTNKALLSKWSYLTVILDTLWGGILFALTTKIVYLVNV
jgi:uncharacterized membrane protein